MDPLLQLLTIDWETYYDDEYSLSKMTTEEYLRDPRFEVIGLSLKVDNAPAIWFSGSHEQVAAFLLQYDIENSSVVAHNAMFDIGILIWHFNRVPKFILDTLSMARAICGLVTSCSLKALAEFFQTKQRKGGYVANMKGRRRLSITPAEMQAYSVYGCDDSEICYELLQRMYRMLPSSELRLIDWTIRAFAQPRLVLDTPLLEAALTDFRARQSTLLRSCGVTDIATLRSDERMAELLLDLGAIPPTKIGAGDKTKWAFSRQDIEFMDLLEHEDERVSALVEARLGLKTSIVESRLVRFLNISKRGPLPFPLAFAGATVSKRWAGTDKINMQNAPRNKYDKATKTTTYSPLRHAIRARPGKKLLVTDLSQIELRMNAWQSGQQDILDLLSSGGDTYAEMASEIYGYPITKAMGKSTHETERFVGKTSVLGCGYQCGDEKFLHMLKVAARRESIKLADESLDFASRVVRSYRSKNRKIVDFWYRAGDIIPVIASGGTAMLGPYKVAMGKVFLPNGTYLYYPDLRMTHDEKTGRNEWTYARVRGKSMTRSRLYGGKLVENITQAVARVVMSDAMLRIMDRYWVLGTVHDEVIVEIDANEDEAEAIAYVDSCMTQRPVWAPDIPLACETHVGNTYAEVK